MRVTRIIASGIGLVFLLAGCATTSRVNFAGPEKARFTIVEEEKEHILPVVLDLEQTNDPEAKDIDVGGRPVRMVLPDGTKLQGFLYVYEAELDEAEKLAEVSFDLSAANIERLKKGESVTVSGFSSRNKPVYKIVLGIDRS